MTKKYLKLLAEKSFKGSYMSPEKVKRIASLLKRGELKQYINYLKAINDQKKVTVIVPKISSDKKSLQTFRKTYPGKRIVYLEDPSILLGTRIIDNDKIYELNLKDTLSSIDDYFKEI